MRKVHVGSEGLQNIADLESPIEVVVESLVGRPSGSSRLHTGFLVSHAAQELIRWTTYVLGAVLFPLRPLAPEPVYVPWVGACQM